MADSLLAEAPGSLSGVARVLVNAGKLDAYTVVDAMVSYQVTDAIGIQLNAQNLFDEEYFDRAHGGGAHVIPGLGRTVILSTNFRF